MNQLTVKQYNVLWRSQQCVQPGTQRHCQHYFKQNQIDLNKNIQNFSNQRNRQQVINSGPTIEKNQKQSDSLTDSEQQDQKQIDIRVRFAPSPTGNLHVGGARTALFNYYYAKQHKGKFILRVEDTDISRSTQESENAVLKDLKWLGLNWDEGPDIGGPYGPYRQKERTDIYLKYVNQLVEKNLAYPCFCTEEELAKMKKEAELNHWPPIYRGQWAKASKEEVEEEKKKGTPYCYRFRVPYDKEISIYDEVRGRVTWNTNTLGDFVVLRSNGLPVYNFCVAIDDALMKISHVIRAEEHLANTIRQILIYDALEIKKPQFAHIALILAQDKSKLSKRHGATSVNQFKEMGYQSNALKNFLSLVGWNDGTEQEIFTEDELIEKFNFNQVTKGAAVFDTAKLGWMNAQYLKTMSDEDLGKLVGDDLYRKGYIQKPFSNFIVQAGKVIKDRLEKISDCEDALILYCAYPFDELLQDEKCKSILEDNLVEVAEAILQYWDEGLFQKIILDGSGKEFKSFTKKLGKDLGRKGKRLFMPIRVCLTGQMEGPDLVDLLPLLGLGDDEVTEKLPFVHIGDRIEKLRSYVKNNKQ